MTTPTTDELATLVGRLEELLAELRQGPPAVEPLAYSIPPEHVASGALIESAWGNSVVDTFFQYSTHTSHSAGTTTAYGPLIVTRTQVLTTNGSGDITSTTPYPFGGAGPEVVVTGAEPGLPYMFTIRSKGASSVTFSVRTLENTIVANGACAFAYIAIGPKP